MWQGITNKFQEHGINFNPDTIRNKSDMDNAAQVLNSVIEKEKKSHRDYGETARLSLSEATGHTFQLSSTDDLPPSLMKFTDEKDMIEKLNFMSKQGNESAKNALNRLNKKMSTGKPIDMEYNGKLLSLIKKDVEILDSDSETVKIAKANRNEALRKDRTNWTDLSKY